MYLCRFLVQSSVDQDKSKRAFSYDIFCIMIGVSDGLEITSVGVDRLSTQH